MMNLQTIFIEFQFQQKKFLETLLFFFFLERSSFGMMVLGFFL